MNAITPEKLDKIIGEIDFSKRYSHGEMLSSPTNESTPDELRIAIKDHTRFSKFLETHGI